MASVSCRGCNVQFSVNPNNDDQIIGIEINPRFPVIGFGLKATGYPIAKIAAALAIGNNLDELNNAITGTTTAYFEPALDYVIVKIPAGTSISSRRRSQTGSQMKSVGEVMGIGRNFQEALQRLCQSLEIRRNGLGADGKELTKQADLLFSFRNTPLEPHLPRV